MAFCPFPGLASSLLVLKIHLAFWPFHAEKVSFVEGYLLFRFFLQHFCKILVINAVLLDRHPLSDVSKICGMRDSTERSVPTAAEQFCAGVLEHSSFKELPIFALICLVTPVSNTDVESVFSL